MHSLPEKITNQYLGEFILQIIYFLMDTPMDRSVPEECINFNQLENEFVTDWLTDMANPNTVVFVELGETNCGLYPGPNPGVRFAH